MTVQDVRPEVLAAGFDFADRQSSPKFRRYLKAAGWKPDTSVTIALDDDKVVTVAHRLAFNQASSPSLVAIPNPVQPYGFALLFAEWVPAGRLRRFLRSTPIEIHADSTIGMVWSTLTGRCGEYAPDGWFQPVMFEKVAVNA